LNLQPKHLQSSALPGWASRALYLARSVIMHFFCSNKYVEILGLDPKITICKIAVLPIKLYPLFFYILALAHKTQRFARYFFLVFIIDKYIRIKYKALRVSDARTLRAIVILFFNPLGVRTRDVTVKALCLNHLTSGS
jgi:hypothetical protein